MVARFAHREPLVGLVKRVMPGPSTGYHRPPGAGRPQGSPLHHAHDAAEITVAGVTLLADCSGALYWPEEQLLVVSDLHLEKGSSFARRGVLLPPYDTASTLEELAGALSRHAVRTVVALGDSFHDQDGPARLAAVCIRWRASLGAAAP